MFLVILLTHMSFIATQKVVVNWVTGLLNQKMLLMKQGEQHVRKMEDEAEEYIRKICSDSSRSFWINLELVLKDIPFVFVSLGFLGFAGVIFFTNFVCSFIHTHVHWHPQ